MSQRFGQWDEMATELTQADQELTDILGDGQVTHDEVPRLMTVLLDIIRPNRRRSETNAFLNRVTRRMETAGGIDRNLMTIIYQFYRFGLQAERLEGAEQSVPPGAEQKESPAMFEIAGPETLGKLAA